MDDSDEMTEALILLPELIDHLPWKEQTVVNGLFYERASYREIARRVGTDTRNVQRIRDRAVGMLRAAILDFQELRA